MLLKNMLRVTLLCFTLTGCSLFHAHQVTVQQGNVITPAMVKQLKPQLSEAKVRHILGRPILVNSFRDDRYNYVYSLHVSGHKKDYQRLTVHFVKGKLVRFETSKT